MKSINALAKSLMKLPGIGPRSARKVAFYLLNNRENTLKPMISAMQTTYEKVSACQQCGNFDELDPCSLCNMPIEENILCIVKDHMDLHSLQATKLFKGRYHILGNNFSPSSENAMKIIASIKQRIRSEAFEEVILAMHASPEGRMILHYLEISIKDETQKLKVTHLGLGIPIGSDFEYIDSETMSFALRNRISLK